MCAKFADDSVGIFLEKLGSGEPTPGGGAAASLSSAMGASLLMMVANHTIGKKKYAEYEELNTRVRDEAEVLLGRFIEGMDNDAEAFRAVTAAYGMPKKFGDIDCDKISAKIAELRQAGIDVSEIDPDEGLSPELIDDIEAGLKAVRSASIGEASIAAAEAPLAVMEDSAAALRLAASLPGRSNRNLLSDVKVAALSLSAGLISAGFNVDANLPAIEKRDPELAARMKARAQELRAEAESLTAQIME